MPKKVNGKNNNSSKEVQYIKLLIIFIILLIPIVFMIFNTTNKLLSYKKSGNNNINTVQKAKIPEIKTSQPEEDFDLNVPETQKGNLENVPKEEIDSLFNNIK